jgi:hypothetical protein
MKLIGTRSVQTAQVINAAGALKTIDYVKSNYYGIMLTKSNTNVEDYDDEFDVHYTMSDDGRQFYGVFHALNEGEDGLVDVAGHHAASDRVLRMALDEVYVKCNPNYNREDVSFMTEVLRNPAWTYTRFVKFGNWDQALDDALKHFDHGDMRDAMINAISATMAGLGVTSITFQEDDGV